MSEYVCKISSFQNSNPDFAEMKDILSRNYWQGKRWITFDLKAGIVGSSDICYFDDFIQAHCYCEDKNTFGTFYRIRPICDVIKQILSREVQSNYKVSADVIRELIEGFPISPCTKKINLSRYFDGNFYMVFWKEIVAPLKYIDKYLVFLSEVEGRELNNKNPKRSDGVWFSDFPSAIKYFQERVKEYLGTENKYYNFFLVGQFKNRELYLDRDGFPLQNSGLLLYSSELFPKSKKNTTGQELIQVNDVCRPLLIYHPVFIRYNVRYNKIGFYDKFLKQIRPGEKIDYLDPRYFHFEPNCSTG